LNLLIRRGKQRTHEKTHRVGAWIAVRQNIVCRRMVHTADSDLLAVGWRLPIGAGTVASIFSGVRQTPFENTP